MLHQGRICDVRERRLICRARFGSGIFGSVLVCSARFGSGRFGSKIVHERSRARDCVQWEKRGSGGVHPPPLEPRCCVLPSVSS